MVCASTKSFITTMLVALGIATFCVGCTPSEFTGKSNQSGNNGTTGGDAENDSDTENGPDAGEDGIDQVDSGEDEDDAGDEIGSDDDEGGDDTASLDDDDAVVRANCWVAVSGGYFGLGHPSYTSSFPKTLSGDAIDHGESFDTVGGVFLNASNDRYELGKGEKEIDKAIELTFDSIAITPGVRLTVWNDAGEEVYDETGPLMILSRDYEDMDPSLGDVTAALAPLLEERADEMPKWMKSYLTKNDFELKKVPGMHKWTKVKVSRLSGQTCR